MPATQPSDAGCSARWLGFAVVAGAFGLLLLLLGLGSAALAARFLAGSHPAWATVTAVEAGGARSRYWAATLEVVDAGGHRFTDTWRSAYPVQIGTTLRVRYQSEPVARIRPDDGRTVWEYAWLFSATGAALLILTAAAFLLSRRAGASLTGGTPPGLIPPPQPQRRGH